MIILKMHFFVFIYLLIICKILEITATKFCHFNWLTDWFIDWLIDCCLFHTINSLQPYMVYMTRTLYFFSVFSMKYKWFFFSFFNTKSFCVLLKNESNKRGRHRSSSIYWLRRIHKSRTLHYNKSVSALLISQLFLQSLRPRNLSFIHRVRVERSRLSPVRQSVALHQHSVIWGHLIWFPLFVLGCRSTVPAFT